MLPEGTELLKKYQNPLEADKLLKVQRDLDEVRELSLFLACIIRSSRLWPYKMHCFACVSRLLALYASCLSCFPLSYFLVVAFQVKDVMLKNIDELLQRGEKLDDLMQRSEDLSNTSYQFYRQAKKSNSCCSSLY